MTGTDTVRDHRRTPRLPGGPRAGQAVAALTLAVSPVCIELSGADAGTASVYRCLLALPALVLLVVPEYRREGPPPRRQLVYGLAGGVLFAGDMLLWTKAITEVGAGLSTVLVNVQVVLVPLLAWAVDHERVPRRFVLWLPVLVVGVVLTGGLFEEGASGSDPAAGTVHAILAALSYSGFLFLLRRGGFNGHVRTTYTAVVLSATLASALGGWAWGAFDPTPSGTALGWLALAALTSGIIGWLMVAVYSPRLPSHVGAVLLLLTPVGALALGAAVLGERPTVAQWAGCTLILVSAYATVTRGRGAPPRRGRPS
ncbi:DMT family transporter [Streptomyces sp. S.PB5]|uniref:DMT family transporter n=1 Tax=Streptomyces sp. S.PB5 TaxID=3020844 RepID=UPI0025B2265D|nr:DMT family transporter [Streptomyces sp. S.PB5]MDN3021984.1 DMT family transporter [Streptomyces sp. S.PB5]